LETIFENHCCPVNLRRRFRNTAPKGRCISERLGKIDGKRQPVVEKIRFQKRQHDRITPSLCTKHALKFYASDKMAWLI